MRSAARVLSQLENPAKGISFGLNISMFSAKEIVTAGILAEKYRFDSVWVPDHLTDLPPSGDRAEPWTILSAIGSRTKRIMLSPCVTDTERRHPAATAHTVATLDELTNGRAALAIGAGEAMNIKPFGLPWEDPTRRTERLGEAVQVVKLLWKSSRANRVDFKGKYYTLTQAWLDQSCFKTHQPRLYVGSLGTPRTLKIVGKYADGWFPWLNTLETFKRRSEIIRREAAAAGRDFDDIERAALLFTAATNDNDLQQKALATVKPEILVIVDRKILAAMGFDVPLPGVGYKYQKTLPTQENADIAAKAAKGMPDDVAADFMIMGDTGQLVEKISQYVKAGARQIVIRDVIGQYLTGSLRREEETLKLFARKIIPYFKSLD